MSKNNDDTFMLFVTAYRHIDEIREGCDEWDRGDTMTDWSFDEIYFGKSYKDQKSHDDLSIVISNEDYNNKNLKVVIAIWSSGDSFGHDENGSAEIMSVHKTLDEAEKASDIIRNSSSSYFDDKTPIGGADLGNGYKLPGYIPWDGYFESLEKVEIV